MSRKICKSEAHEAPDENAEENGHDISRVPRLAGGWVELIIVAQGHAKPEGQAIAEEDDHHGVAHAQTNLEAIAHTAWPSTEPSTNHNHQPSFQHLSIASTNHHLTIIYSTIIQPSSKHTIFASNHSSPTSKSSFLKSPPDRACATALVNFSSSRFSPPKATTVRMAKRHSSSAVERSRREAVVEWRRDAVDRWTGGGFKASNGGGFYG